MELTIRCTRIWYHNFKNHIQTCKTKLVWWSETKFDDKDEAEMGMMEFLFTKCREYVRLSPTVFSKLRQIIGSRKRKRILNVHYVRSSTVPYWRRYQLSQVIRTDSTGCWQAGKAMKYCRIYVRSVRRERGFVRT